MSLLQALGPRPRLERPTKVRRYTMDRNGTIYLHKALGYGSWSSEASKKTPKAVRAVLEASPTAEVEFVDKEALVVPYFRKMHI